MSKDNKKQEGIIRDENENLRYDSGEAAKDSYERADAYEKDRIELRGITFFTIGLLLLIGVTFGLMALLQRAMEDQTRAGEMGQKSPMAMTADETMKSMPGPRLQAAPGFGIEREDGTKVNLELREPQSEYRELRKQWKEIWEKGRKDTKTGTIITLPIEEAKKKVLDGNLIKSRAAEQADKANIEVRQIPSFESAGRATETRRQ